MDDVFDQIQRRQFIQTIMIIVLAALLVFSVGAAARFYGETDRCVTSGEQVLEDTHTLRTSLSECRLGRIDALEAFQTEAKGWEATTQRCIDASNLCVEHLEACKKRG